VIDLSDPGDITGVVTHFSRRSLTLSDRDDVLDRGSADVRDVGLDCRMDRAGPGGSSDALLKAGRHPREIQVTQSRRGLEVVALLSDSRQAPHREPAGAEAVLQRLELGAFQLPVGDVRLIPWRSRSVCAS
jgi:hypothetical protein